MIVEQTQTSDVIWQCVPFDALDTRTLYALLALRLSVFVVEQNCPYQELDGKDLAAWHLLGYRHGELVATSRILAPGVSYDGASSIGRVVTAPSERGTGLGPQLMSEAVAACQRLFPTLPIRIGAQAHLQRFYGRLGFVAEGAQYLEDGIPHVEMTRPVGA
ncbi:GNAT family N-acetyltransferase [Saccharospirillum mangrovi]|uniref:GNAT family N-acetyltransferase n=1 Tax=Saccharospirillum mangrovi TaxID=2161747 RepID=UPI001E506308|nr:GNAT family N-acetyltransferase [Saccharospirillum mangrovi]